MTQPLASQRDLFEIPAGTTYLNAAAYVPLPRAVREAGQRGVTTKSAPWDMAASHGHDIAERARTAAADRLGVLRVSPHVYNDEGDVAAFAAGLREEARQESSSFLKKRTKKLLSTR